MGLGPRAVEGLGVTASTARAYEDLFAGAYRDKRVLVTGHNGFVGTWLCVWLARCGADVTGLSLAAGPGPLAPGELCEYAREEIADVRDAARVADVIRRVQPEVVFHLAAQALVLPSYSDPVATFDTNVMGTVHVLDAVRRVGSVASCVVVTSDKCYATRDGAHLEADHLGGDDPYSASKGAAELVAHAYRASFFGGGPALATARAGNIVGGGDFAPGRIVPDCVRALDTGMPLDLRRPDAVRPWQHVLDVVAGYLLLGAHLADESHAAAEAWNFGPDPRSVATVGQLVALVEASWSELGGGGLVELRLPVGNRAPERAVLTLDSTKAQARLGWTPRLDLTDAVRWTVEWYHAARRATGFCAARALERQIDCYLDPGVLAHAGRARAGSLT